MSGPSFDNDNADPSITNNRRKKQWKFFKFFACFASMSAAAPLVLIKIGVSGSTMKIQDETTIVLGRTAIEISARNATGGFKVYPADDPPQHVPTAAEKITVSSSSSSSTNPQLWIHVVDWAEGMAGWRPALHEMATLARLYNATLVEPCASQGRLLSCASNREDSKKLRLRDLLDVSALKEHIWPRIASFEEFATATGYNLSWASDENDHKVFTSSTKSNDPHNSIPIYQTCLCSLKRGACRRVEPPLDTTYNQTSQLTIQQAVQNSRTQPTILEIVLYRRHALQNMKHKGHDLQHYTQQTHHKMQQLVGFPPGAMERVQALLNSWNITLGSTPFAVLQWRPEVIPSLDYQACATALLQARDHVHQRSGIPLENFILISPLSQHQGLQWGGVKQLANQQRQTSFRALTRLLRRGFKKLEQSSAFLEDIDNDGVPDGGLLAIWDFILAQTATTFSTCSGCNETQICSQCSYQGHSVEYVLELREQYTSGKQGVTTDTCWPEGDAAIN